MSYKKILLALLMVLSVSVLFAEVHYPLTIVDSLNREVTIEKQPSRVVSLGPNITETIYAVGKGNALVGRTDYCDYPAEVASVAAVGSITDPVVEKIIELDPDVVIGSVHVKPEMIAQLEKAGIAVAAFYSDESFQGVYELILKTGKVLNAERAAADQVAEMVLKVSEVTSRVAGLEKPSVYYVVGFGEWGDYTAGNGTFISQMIGLAGGINIADDMEGWKYSLEKLVDHDPDLVVCSRYWGAEEGIRVANGYKDLTAIKKNRLYAIDNNMLDRQGPRLADGLEVFAKIFHPEAFK